MPRTQDRVALKKSQSFKKIIEEFFGKMDVHLFAIGQLTLRSRSLQVFALIAPANAELSSAEGGLLPAVKREHLKPRGFERNRFLYSQGTAWESGSRNRRNTCRPPCPDGGGDEPPRIPGQFSAFGNSQSRNQQLQFAAANLPSVRLS